MSIAPQTPGEIYEDREGNRWLVTAICPEPVVRMQMIEPVLFEDQSPPTFQYGGVSAPMWDGFAKVLDAPSPPKERNDA